MLVDTRKMRNKYTQHLQNLTFEQWSALDWYWFEYVGKYLEEAQIGWTTQFWRYAESCPVSKGRGVHELICSLTLPQIMALNHILSNCNDGPLWKTWLN